MPSLTPLEKATQSLTALLASLERNDETIFKYIQRADPWSRWSICFDDRGMEAQLQVSPECHRVRPC
jgi:hypothetical protein